MISYEDFMIKALADARPGREYGTKQPDEPCFYVQWSTGGMSGGSCWGGEAEPFEGEREAQLTSLMEFLDDLDIRLRHANAILNEVKEDTFSETGYYGNYTDYAYKLITVAAVHAKLVEFGYVAPKP